MSKPAFLITVDTEGDNLWRNPRAVSTRNAHFAFRFHALCQSFDLPITWLTNHEMASCPVFTELALQVQSLKETPCGGGWINWSPCAPPRLNCRRPAWRGDPARRGFSGQ